jgi:hypothetical protein
VLHPAILQCALEGSRYRVLKGPNGTYNLWRFRNWKKDPKGWTLIDQASDEETAYQLIHERFGLLPEKPRPTVVYATITFRTDYDPGDPYAWWGI